MIDLSQLITAEAKLAQLRERLRAAINSWRDEQERGAILFEQAGRTWDGGLSVRTRIKPLLGLPVLPEGFFWTDADDNDVPITLPELQALDVAHELAIVTQGWAIHSRQRQMKQEVESLDAEALAVYVVGWPT